MNGLLRMCVWGEWDELSKEAEFCLFVCVAFN